MNISLITKDILLKIIFLNICLILKGNVNKHERVSEVIKQLNTFKLILRVTRCINFSLKIIKNYPVISPYLFWYGDFPY